MAPDTPQLGAAGKSTILFGSMLPAIATGTIAVMLPGISDAFGNGNGLLVKMVSTATGLGMMVGAPLGGALADAIGRRTVLAVGAAIFALIGLSAMFATGLWQLIGIRFIIGLTAGAVPTCLLALIGDYFHGPSQSKWLGLNGAMATFLVVILSPVAGALADTGWRNGFLVYAAALLIMPLILFGVPRHAGTAATGPQVEGKVRFGLPVATLLLAVIVGTLTTGTSLYWPFKLRELGVLSARDMAFYVLPNIILIAGSSLLYSKVRRRLSMTQIFAGTGLLSALGLLVMALAATPMQVAIGLMVEGVAIGMLTPNLSMYAISISSAANRARTIGLMKGVYYGSPFVTQFGLEAINHLSGVGAALAAIAIMGGGMGLFMLILSLRQRPAVAGVLPS